VSNRADADNLLRFVDVVNDAVHVTLRAVQQMPQLLFAFLAFRSYRAAARKLSKGVDSALESIKPKSGFGGIVSGDLQI